NLVQDEVAGADDRHLPKLQDRGQRQLVRFRGRSVTASEVKAFYGSSVAAYRDVATHDLNPDEAGAEDMRAMTLLFLVLVTACASEPTRTAREPVPSLSTARVTISEGETFRLRPNEVAVTAGG